MQNRFLEQLKRYWLVMLVIGLIGFTVVSLPMTWLISPKYESYTTIAVKDDQNKEQEQTYRNFLKSSSVLSPVAKQFKEDKQNLAKQFKIKQEGDGLYQLSVWDRRPKQAVEKTDALLSAFEEKAPEVLSVEKVTVLTPAREATRPSFPHPYLWGIGGGVVSVGIALVTLFYRVKKDDSIYHTSFVEKELGWELLGVLPEMSKEQIEVTRLSRERQYKDQSYSQMD